MRDGQKHGEEIAGGRTCSGSIGSDRYCHAFDRVDVEVE